MSDHAIEQPHGAHVHETGDHEHPGAGVYILVAVVLIALTAMEIGVFYAPFLQSWLIPLLVVLAILKFILVARLARDIKSLCRHDQAHWQPTEVAVLA